MPAVVDHVLLAIVEGACGVPTPVRLKVIVAPAAPQEDCGPPASALGGAVEGWMVTVVSPKHAERAGSTQLTRRRYVVAVAGLTEKVALVERRVAPVNHCVSMPIVQAAPMLEREPSSRDD